METKQSVVVAGPLRNVAEIGLIDGNELHGTIDAVIFFNEDAYLSVHEKVKTTGDQMGTPSREEYAYQLVVNGLPIGRWHYEPRLPRGQRYHFDDNLGGEHHQPDKHRSLKDVVNTCWTIIDEVQRQIEEGQIG